MAGGEIHHPNDDPPGEWAAGAGARFLDCLEAAARAGYARTLARR
ncbi:hypothetical protein [Nonomuraea cypriaca]|nr:hypothetical protein [Nonomuraea cypriaca]